MERQQGRSACLQLVAATGADCYCQRIAGKCRGKAVSQRMERVSLQQGVLSL